MGALDKNILLANLEIAQKRVDFYTSSYAKANSARLKAHTKKALAIVTVQLEQAKAAMSAYNNQNA